MRLEFSTQGAHVYCLKCGSETVKGAKYCSKCGARVTAESDPEPSQPHTIVIDGDEYKIFPLVGSKYSGFYSRKRKWYRIKNGNAERVRIGAWQNTHWALRTLMIAGIVVVAVFFAALINEDANYLVKTFTGIDLQSSVSTPSGGSAGTLNTVTLRAECSSNDCDVRVSNPSGAKDTHQSTPSRYWTLKVPNDYEIYSVSVRDNRGGSASCTATGFGESDSQESTNSSVRCSVSPGF